MIRLILILDILKYFHYIITYNNIALFSRLNKETI